MKHFTIDPENAITLHATKKAAKDTGLPVFSTEEQFADAIGNDNARLLAIWNSLPGVAPVKKFANRKVATERIWKAVQGLGQPADAQPAPDFESCAQAVEAAAVPETPFDAEPTPDPVASEHQAAIESAPVHVEEQPARPVAAAEHVAPVSAQTLDVAPETATTTKKATRAKTARKAQTEATAAADPGAIETVAEGQPNVAVEVTEATATAGAQGADATPENATATNKATRKQKAPKAQQEAKTEESAAPREGTKTAQVVALLKRDNGATISEIMQRMGWLKHTVRGFMAGAMRKAGYTVESFKPEGGERSYRINS